MCDGCMKGVWSVYEAVERVRECVGCVRGLGGSYSRISGVCDIIR